MFILFCRQLPKGANTPRKGHHPLHVFVVFQGTFALKDAIGDNVNHSSGNGSVNGAINSNAIIDGGNGAVEYEIANDNSAVSYVVGDK